MRPKYPTSAKSEISTRHRLAPWPIRLHFRRSIKSRLIPAKTKLTAVGIDDRPGKREVVQSLANHWSIQMVRPEMNSARTKLPRRIETAARIWAMTARTEGRLPRAHQPKRNAGQNQTKGGVGLEGPASGQQQMAP